jgi:hypothetical protein
MSNTNTVADYMQKTRAELTAFSGMCNHNGYAYLDDSQLQSNDQAHLPL